MEKGEAIERIMRNQLRMSHLIAFDKSDPLLTSHLTMPQFRLMLVLKVRGGASGQDLAESMGVTLATITGIVDRLHAHDLVTRREDPRDRRVRRVELTGAGQSLIDGIVTAGLSNLRRLLNRLSVDDLGVVEQAFVLLMDAIDSERAEDQQLPNVTGSG